MKLREKIKRFWTLDVHNHQGFTLVELIIVIAILAILSSVAVVGYSSYIKKANKAADEALLYEINQAFRAACIENMCDVFDISAKWDMENMTVASVKDDADHPIISSFEEFFDVANPKFKVIEDIYFNSSVGLWQENTLLQYAYGDGYITLRASDIAALQNSAFAEIGADKLLAMVDMAASLIDITNETSTLGQLAQSEAAMALLYERLGVSSVEEIGALMAAKYPQGDMTDDEYNEFLDQKYNQLVANNAVLYAAQNSAVASETIWDVLKAENVKETIKKNSNTEEQLAQSAMAFAMYSAYTGTDSLDGVSLTDVYTTLDSAEFKAYLETEQAQADLAGYLASVNMVDDGVASDPDAAADVLLEGFTDEELAALLEQIAGG